MSDGVVIFTVGSCKSLSELAFLEIIFKHGKFYVIMMD